MICSASDIICFSQRRGMPKPMKKTALNGVQFFSASMMPALVCISISCSPFVDGHAVCHSVSFNECMLLDPSMKTFSHQVDRIMQLYFWRDNITFSKSTFSAVVSPIQRASHEAAVDASLHNTSSAASSR